MGRKPEAGGAKVEETDPEQSARFIEAARQVGMDETGKALERAFDAVTRRPPAAKGGADPPGPKPKKHR